MLAFMLHYFYFQKCAFAQSTLAKHVILAGTKREPSKQTCLKTNNTYLLMRRTGTYMFNFLVNMFPNMFPKQIIVVYLRGPSNKNRIWATIDNFLVNMFPNMFPKQIIVVYLRGTCQKIRFEQKSRIFLLTLSLCTSAGLPEEAFQFSFDFFVWRLIWLSYYFLTVFVKRVSAHIRGFFGLAGKFPYLQHIMLAGTEREPSKQSLWEKIKRFGI